MFQISNSKLQIEKEEQGQRQNFDVGLFQIKKFSSLFQFEI